MNRTRTTAGERNLSRMAKAFSAFALMITTLLLAGSLSKVAAQTIPNATASSSTLITTLAGQAGKIAANNFGDVFYIDQSTNDAYWVKHGTTTPIILVTGLSGGRNVYVDSANNLYVPSTYGGFILEVPFANGTYATNFAAGNASGCASVTPTAPCTQGSAGAPLSYYYQPLDVSRDAAGNLYAIDSYPNGSCTAGNCVVEFPVTGTTYGTPVVLANNIEANDYNAQFNVAPNGDVYYANGTLVYYLAAGTTKAVSVGSFTNPTGTAVDALGNVYITNSSAPNNIYEFPAVNGVAQPTKQFALLATYSGNGAAVDGLGDIFYTGYSTAVNVNVATLNAVNVGSSPVGTPNAAATNVTFTFGAATTVASINATGGSYTYAPGSCAAGAYAAGSSCTVNVNFVPNSVGARRGAVNLDGANGVPLATALLYGTGVGAAQTNDPGTVSLIGSGFSTPQGIHSDSQGNLLVADPGLNQVLRYAGGTGTPVSIGTGLSKPNSVATDNAGNVFIADSGNGRVVVVPNVNGVLTNSAQQVVISGLSTMLSVAIGPYGNLYIADAAQTTITKLSPIGGMPSTSAKTTLGSGFKMPYAITVDRIGNVFVADYSTNLVTEINFYGGAQNTVGAGLSKPSGLVTDAAGSIYIADTGNARLLKVPFENGAYNTNDQYLVGTGVANPFGVAIDGAGNLYATDAIKATVTELNRVAGNLNLGRAQIMTSTAPSNGYIGNAGNANLTLGTPDYVAVSNMASYFSVTSPATNGCANAASVAPGFACIVSATFSPQTTGSYNDLLTFSSNAVNGAPQTLNITGLGLNLSKTTTTLSQTSPAGNASFGMPVTITAVVASTVAGTPTGNVTFSVDGSTQTNPPAVVNGMASITLSNLTGGPHTITASYTGDNSYAPSNGTVTITVLQATSMTSVAITGTYPGPASATPGTAVTLTATIVANASTAPTGGVTFRSGSTVLNTTPIPVTASNGGFTAQLTTTALVQGNDTITATYSGDVNYSGSTGSSAVLVSLQTFTLTPAAATVTVPAGQTAVVNLVATSIAGFASNTTYLGLSCAGLPANTACAFNPNNFYFQQGVPQPITLAIFTGQTPVGPQPVVGSFGGGGSLGVRLALMLFTLGPLVLMVRRKTTSGLKLAGRLALLLVVSLGMQALAGCGGSGFVGVTPKGSYNVTVTATGTALYKDTNTTYAPGCTVATDTLPYTNPAPYLTCVQTTNVTLVIQ